MPDREAIPYGKIDDVLADPRVEYDQEDLVCVWYDDLFDLRERVAVLTEEVAEWKAASMHHDPESGVKANAAGWCVSWKAERRRVTVLTEERDELLTENAAYDRSLADHVRMLGDAEARVAVLTEERDEARRELREFHALHVDEDERVAVLEAGLRALADAADAMSASRTAWNAPSLNRSLRDAATAARALLGGVPATKEEQT